MSGWRKDNNSERPHSRLFWQTLTKFAQTFASQLGRTLRKP
jgi:putative transposase